MRTSLALALTLPALALAGCGSSSSPAPSTGTAAQAATKAPAAAKAHVTVQIRNYMFLPMHLTVHAGTAVSFHNQDATAHTATAIDNGFDSGTIAPKGTQTVTFRKAGTFKYHCLFHAFMNASITVVP